jgi:UDP-N-acetylglucosamine--N-acetylmuramyl-(pentapeptide) pyrophosphoryl-undecaprenol N-acetylglucosamine transferase
VRQDLIDIDSKRAAAIEYFNLDATKKTLLVRRKSWSKKSKSANRERIGNIQTKMFR